MLGSELKEFGIYTTIFLVFIFILFALFSPSPPLFRFIILLAHPWYSCMKSKLRLTLTGSSVKTCVKTQRPSKRDRATAARQRAPARSPDRNRVIWHASDHAHVCALPGGAPT